MTRDVLDDLSPASFFAGFPPTLSEIMEEAAAYYQISAADLVYHPTTRNANLQSTHVRRVVCFLARELTRQSHEVIAERVGYWSHTAVFQSHRSIARRAKHEAVVKDDLDILTRRLLDRVILRCEGSKAWH
jgi:chromosomal replication initiation ATPase DnaA